MSDPLISILMPVRNTAMYLKDCVQSILNQTEQHWELLAIDDHSTDNSWAILSAFSKKDARIKVFQNKGRGIITALRLAFSESKGKLITRMDSDDLMVSQKLAALKRPLLKKGRGYLTTGLVHYFSDNELGEGYRKYQNWLNSLTQNGTNFSEIYKECVIPSPCWMVYRNDLKKCQAFHLNRYPEDYDLCFRFYEQRLKVIPCNVVLHHWRDYAQRTSRTDKHYRDNSFLLLKMSYFLQLDYNAKRPLLLWGAGKKGKWIAQYLVQHQYSFQWICNNDKKIGKEIYGQLLQPISTLNTIQRPQLIISVAGPTHQLDIQKILKEKNLRVGEDYFFFC
ncbi:MAG: glycosyltransferase family 2 protein [Bacteroidota bacterium]